MITLLHVYYEIHDEVSKNDKVHKVIYELELVSVTPLSNYCKDANTSWVQNLRQGIVIQPSIVNRVCGS